MGNSAQHTVLIIDDNPSNLKLLHELLSDNNYRVRVADSSRLGLDSARTTPPDLILLDIKMPEMDGYEICQALKADTATESVPVIFISASANTLNKVKALEVGGMDYINKPFDAAEVLARIQNHLQLSILQKQTKNLLTTSQYMLQAIMNNSPAVIYIKDLYGRYLMVNREYEKLVHMTNEEIKEKSDRDLFNDRKIVDFFTKNDRNVLESEQHKQFEDMLKLKDNELYYLTLKFPLKDANEHTYAVCGICTDITMRKRAEAELEHMATYDILTELPNRSLFMELLSRTLSSSQREKTIHAILFIDLDNFKNINDSLGHHVGDLLLKEVAQRLVKCTRSADTVSRLGGDEFVLLLQRIRHPAEAAEVSKKIIQELSPVFVIDDRTVYITPSIGIVISPENGTDAQKLLQNADTAMYHAKNKGRNTYQFFTEEMNQRVIYRMEIEKELRQALHDKTIIPFFQPKIESKTGRIIGFEALARWHSEKLGEVSPATFIPIAEDVNLIISLDQQILETSIQLFSPLIKDNLFDGTISINLTAQHFYRDHLLEFLDKTLAKFHFPAEHLELEITEGSVMKNTDDAISLMNELHERGIQLSIDDFGTGYSSLSYLKKFPVKSLKIDLSFIRDLGKSTTETNLVKSIINLASGLGLECVAEGVETIEQAKILNDFQCDILQGFLFSRAIDFMTAVEIIKNDKKFTDHL